MYEGIIVKDISEIERELGLRGDCKIIGVKIENGAVEFRYVSTTNYSNTVELNSSITPMKTRVK